MCSAALTVAVAVLVSRPAEAGVAAGRAQPPTAARDVPQDQGRSALRRGIGALRNGELAEAVAIFRALVERDAGSAEARFWLGLAHLRAGAPADAIGPLLEAEALTQGLDARIVYQLGVALMRAGRFDQARMRFERVEQRDPANPLPRLNLGWIAMQQDQAARALASFEAVLADHPDEPNAHYFAGRVHEGLGDFDAARVAYRRAIEASPDFLEALLALGNLAMIQGDLEAAGARLEHAVEAHPDSAEARARLGELEARRGALDAAIDDLEAALSIDPAHQAARYNLGLAYARAGRAEEASSAMARFDDNLSKAAAAERAARRRNAETRSEALRRRAGAHADAGQWHQAIEALRQAALLTPADVRVWELLARAYEAVDDTAGLEHARRQIRLLRRTRP